MRILIVEDEGPKCNKILACIKEIPSCNESIADVARSVRSALDFIDENIYDVILLDMSLPTFDISEDEQGGRPQGFGGLEVMRDLSNLEMFTPVIVVTAYEYFSDEHDDKESGKEATLAELAESLSEEFPEFFCGLVKYETYSDEWRVELSSFMSKLIAR